MADAKPPVVFVVPGSLAQRTGGYVYDRRIIAELRAARREDVAGKFKPWKPRHLPCPTKSK